MIDRYSVESINEIWNRQSKLKLMLEVELTVCEVMEEEGMVPQGTSAICRWKTSQLMEKGFDLQRVDSIEKEVRHDVIAFLTYVNETVGEVSRHLHKGMTSSDVVDTVFSLQMKRSAEVILMKAEVLLSSMKHLSQSHADTLCIGRSHGMHAEPTTFGFKMAVHWNSLNGAVESFREAAEKASLGKLSGAVGVYAHFPPEVEEKVCERLGLDPSPISTQIIQRDVFARYFQAMALLATVLENFAVEIRHLHRTEVAEVQEGFRKGQKGSSAMPHKKNPILSENVTGLARMMRSYANSALENVVLWHERDISHSSVERIIGPDATNLMAFMLGRVNTIVQNLQVNPQAMSRNLQATSGAFLSQKKMLKLVERGHTREEAYAISQKEAFSINDKNLGVPEESLKWYVRRVKGTMDRLFYIKDKSG